MSKKYGMKPSRKAEGLPVDWTVSLTSCSGGKSAFMKVSGTEDLLADKMKELTVIGNVILEPLKSSPFIFRKDHLLQKKDEHFWKCQQSLQVHFYPSLPPIYSLSIRFLSFPSTFFLLQLPFPLHVSSLPSLHAVQTTPSQSVQWTRAWSGDWDISCFLWRDRVDGGGKKGETEKTLTCTASSQSVQWTRFPDCTGVLPESWSKRRVEGRERRREAAVRPNSLNRCFRSALLLRVQLKRPANLILCFSFTKTCWTELFYGKKECAIQQDPL